MTSLIMIHALIGISEGPFCPTILAVTVVATKPSRRRALQSLQQSSLPYLI
ncbi:hypothetical protein RMB03_00315 [Acinetobacter sp. V91_7]|nr:MULTISPECIES: hypothetical protein [Acinetobacter]MDS7932445.1 hypothetical protein [Acinetobacter sp. V91_4B]MDS7961412.1 hypothetical protein [Acinetobacter sp. V91_7]MDS8025926.1 hypothetical protein [Acinetobacter sp. V91_13]